MVVRGILSRVRSYREKYIDRHRQKHRQRNIKTTLSPQDDISLFGRRKTDVIEPV